MKDFGDVTYKQALAVKMAAGTVKQTPTHPRSQAAGIFTAWFMLYSNRSRYCDVGHIASIYRTLLAETMIARLRTASACMNYVHR